MSYDIEIGVRVADTDLYACIATPEYNHPTYNLSQMFRVATGWDYEQGKWYRCEEVMPMIVKGIYELRVNKDGKYFSLQPKNGWGTISGAIDCLDSMRTCIYEKAEEIPIEHLWVRW